MKSVACIGQGFVGGSLTTVLSERGTRVYVHDKAGKCAQGGIDPLVPQGTNIGRARLNVLAGTHDLHDRANVIKEFADACETDPSFSSVYFVCLPTPMFPDGSADLSIVDDVLRQLADSCPAGTTRIAVVKSTVPPGSTERWNALYGSIGLHVIFNPEFLTEANALDDMRNQNRIVLGGPRPWINTVKQVFQTAFPAVTLIKTSSTTAEMVKYVTNCFLATKVAFANEIAQVCEALDNKGLNIDYDKVVEYAKLDKRLGQSHWSVPGPDGSRGFGGHCFPKDLNAMLAIAVGLGIDPKVLKAVWDKNLEVRHDRDWERMAGRAVSTKKPQMP